MAWLANSTLEFKAKRAEKEENKNNRFLPSSNIGRCYIRGHGSLSSQIEAQMQT